MNRIQSSNHGGKSLARSLKDLVCDRVNREGFVGNLKFADEFRDFGIEDFLS
jgi:hypothetical protein